MLSENIHLTESNACYVFIIVVVLFILEMNECIGIGRAPKNLSILSLFKRRSERKNGIKEYDLAE